MQEEKENYFPFFAWFLLIQLQLWWGATKEEEKKETWIRKSKKHRRTKSPNLKTSRLRVVDQEHQFKWELLDTMTLNGNYHLNIFIQEKDLKEPILKTISVPSNLQEVRRMDKFMAQLLKEKRQKTLLRKSREKTWMLWGRCVSYGKV